MSIEALMAAGSAMLIGKLCPTTVNATYRRLGKTDLSVSVAYGAERFEAVEDDNGTSTLEVANRDFFFAPSELTDWGTGTVPVRGDRILLTIGGQARAYEVLPDQFDGQCYRESDRYNAMLRVHTKRVKL